MSIRMYGLIPRKPGMDRDEFHDYYRHPHGTMGRNMTTMRGYVQNHQIDTDRLGPDQGRFDAVAEIWLDNEADVQAFRQEPILVRYLLEDEPKFVDMPNLRFFAADSEVLVSGPRQNAGLHPGDEMWSPATRPLSVKLLLFVDADGNPDWARADDEALAGKLGAFRHTRATPLLPSTATPRPSSGCTSSGGRRGPPSTVPSMRRRTRCRSCSRAPAGRWRCWRRRSASSERCGRAAQPWAAAASALDSGSDDESRWGCTRQR